MRANQIYVIILFFLILSLISSTILSTKSTAEICGVGVGCDNVQNSKYASLFGIKNSVYGIVLFSILIILTLTLVYIRRPKEKLRRLVHLGIFIAAIISVYFLILQQFIIYDFCKFCLIVDISMIASAILILISKKEV